MTLTANEIAGGFSCLSLEYGLLSPYPSQFGNSEYPDGVQIKTQRGRYADPPTWGVNAKMYILDISVNDIDIEIAQGNLCHINTRFAV